MRFATVFAVATCGPWGFACQAESIDTLDRCFQNVVGGAARVTDGLVEVSYETLGMHTDEWRAMGEPRYFTNPAEGGGLVISKPFGAYQQCLATTGYPGEPSSDGFRSLVASHGLEIPPECDGYREEGIDGNIKAIGFEENSAGVFVSARYFVSPVDGLTWIAVREHDFPSSSSCDRQYLRNQ